MHVDDDLTRQVIASLRPLPEPGRWTTIESRTPRSRLTLTCPLSRQCTPAISRICGRTHRPAASRVPPRGGHPPGYLGHRQAGGQQVRFTCHGRTPPHGTRPPTGPVQPPSQPRSGRRRHGTPPARRRQGASRHVWHSKPPFPRARGRTRDVLGHLALPTTTSSSPPTAAASPSLISAHEPAGARLLEPHGAGCTDTSAARRYHPPTRHGPWRPALHLPTNRRPPPSTNTTSELPAVTVGP